MLPPFIRRPRKKIEPRSKERGVTMALVAITMVAIISMAALAIDIGTLYEAKAEAQRTADAAALTAARVISISGITGDPNNSTSSWQPVCGGSTSPATLAATTVAQQNLIGGVQASTINVYYGTNGGVGTNTDCTTSGTAFGVNPIVTVNVQRTNLPVFFARVFSLFGSRYSGSSVSASATAEAFNPSASNTVDPNGKVIPVNPRCVKPWIIPNIDPISPKTAPNNYFVTLANGSIVSPGVSSGPGTGVIGENFTIAADCRHHRANCNGGNMIPGGNPPQSTGGTIHYVPALVTGTPTAVPSCATADTFEEASGGCDQGTVYACGVQQGNQADLNENPVNPNGLDGDTGTAVQCLTNSTSGPDHLSVSSFPFQIQAGSGNALVSGGAVSSGSVIMTSNSIVTIPIYDQTAGTGGPVPLVGTQPYVTIVGFLQVFIQNIAANGELNVYVLNVAGCGNGLTTTVSSSPVFGTSPVPVRLITSP
jgi:Flp pilus assembly protein TadG